MELFNTILSYHRFAKLNIAKQKLHERDIGLLSSLPEALLTRIREEVFSPLMLSHPLFGHIHRQDAACMTDICHAAMSEMAVPVGEQLFRPGMKCSSMYMIYDGRMEYECNLDGEEHVPENIRTGRWLCEPAMWTDWKHRGHLRSIERTELMVLDCVAFQAVISESYLFCQVQDYARVYAAMAVKSCGGAGGVTDMWGSSKKIAACLERACRLGRDAQAAGKLMMLWGDGENQLATCFVVWKKHAARMNALRAFANRYWIFCWLRRYLKK